MDDGPSPDGLVLREGEGIAWGPDVCFTLEGAFEEVKKAFLAHHPDGDVGLLNRAFAVGRDSHRTQVRVSGEPYFFHPLRVAWYLADWRLDAVSVACGMLHDTVEDTLMTQEEVKRQFGEEVSDIVDGLTKMSKLAFTDKHLLNAENVRKLLVAMGKDVRVLLVKLADRLHNMETLGAMRHDKRRRIAWETLELYAPLANRLGMGSVRSQLEDLAFQTLEPERFGELQAAMDGRRKKNAQLIAEVKETLQAALRMQGIHADVYGRSKHLYGIWRKMGVQAKGLDEIHDWLAYRIICPDRATCYTALGLVHALYKPIPGRFKDYISLPKDNGYQSIHTSALMPSGDSFEVQIRTQDMHEHAEAGIACHWTYKEGRIANRQEINQVAFLRRMVELHQDAKDSRDLVANLKGELSFRRIQVFTPKGDLRSLPEASTPVDFAYSIHTEVGHRCVGAKVNGRMVPLRHALQNGDRVEILTRNDHKPSRDWLGFVKSASAKARIQAFIREEERKQAISQGRERLEKESRNFSINLADDAVKKALEQRLAELKLANWDACYAALGFSRITVHKLLEPLIPETQKGKAKPAQALADDAVTVDDNVGVLYYLALCCKPIYGDEIVGYITRGRGIAIHKGNCSQLQTSSFHPERRVSVAWGRVNKGVYDTELVLKTEDRPGMVAAISEAVQKSNINMQRFNASSTEEGTGLFQIALRVRDRIQLVELMANLRRVRGVITVERIRGSAFGKVR